MGFFVAYRKMKKGFTLVELAVAVALLAMVISFASLVSRVSIGTHRAATANAEIMQELRAITDQLNSDFAGLVADAPVAMLFEYDNTTGLRHDAIMFFSAGDFQSIRQYDNGGSSDVTISGNTARIYYGQADIIDSGSGTVIEDYNDSGLLARRQHILTADAGLVDDFPEWDQAAQDFGDFVYDKNNEYEYDVMSLAEWKTVPQSRYDSYVMPRCLDSRSEVDTNDPDLVHIVMCQGVGDLKIQIEEWHSAGNRWVWWPSKDRYGDGSQDDLPAGNEVCGHYYNVAGGADFTDSSTSPDVNWKYFSTLPRAIKFTFTLYDSKGVIAGGKRFTYIVTLGD